MKDLVTVFTPVYNRKNLIGNLYQSLLSQTYKNFEWINYFHRFFCFCTFCMNSQIYRF